MLKEFLRSLLRGRSLINITPLSLSTPYNYPALPYLFYIFTLIFIIPEKFLLLHEEGGTIVQKIPPKFAY
jgi:hypothetical protein